MKRVDTAIMLAHAAGAFATTTGFFKVEETPYEDGLVGEAGHYSTLDRALREVVALAEGGELMADEGENPTTGQIEPYVHFCDLEEFMIQMSGRPHLIFKGDFEGGPLMTYTITFIRLDDEDEPGSELPTLKA